MARWLEYLQEDDFEILHRRGRKHTNADALSHLLCRQCSREYHSPAIIAATPIMPGGCQQEDLWTARLADADIAPALQAKQADQCPGEDKLKEMSLTSRRLVQLWEQLVVRDGRHPVPTIRRFHGEGRDTTARQNNSIVSPGGNSWQWLLSSSNLSPI